jgi:hypothetical protein
VVFVVAVGDLSGVVVVGAGVVVVGVGAPTVGLADVPITLRTGGLTICVMVREPAAGGGDVRFPLGRAMITFGNCLCACEEFPPHAASPAAASTAPMTVPDRLNMTGLPVRALREDGCGLITHAYVKSWRVRRSLG